MMPPNTSMAPIRITHSSTTYRKQAEMFRFSEVAASQIPATLRHEGFRQCCPKETAASRKDRDVSNWLRKSFQTPRAWLHASSLIGSGAGISGKVWSTHRATSALKAKRH